MELQAEHGQAQLEHTQAALEAAALHLKHQAKHEKLRTKVREHSSAVERYGPHVAISPAMLRSSNAQRRTKHEQGQRAREEALEQLALWHARHDKLEEAVAAHKAEADAEAVAHADARIT